MDYYSQKTEIELLTQLGQSDESAFTEIYNRYWQKLFVIAAKRLNNLEEAEEIVQDIFTALWVRRFSLDLTSDLSSYMAVSVKYRVIKTMNKYYTKQKYIDSILSQGQKVDDSTQQLLALEELQKEVAKYVGQLPDKCRLVFQLSREKGYSQKQIAQKLGISEKTVEAHLGKAFKVLRSKLAGFMTTLL